MGMWECMGMHSCMGMYGNKVYRISFHKKQQEYELVFLVYISMRADDAHFVGEICILKDLSV